MNYRFQRYALYAALAGLSSLGTLLAVHARAAGIPDDEVLTYTGYLEDADGAPLKGDHSISVRFWAAASGGNDLCTAEADTLNLQAGRFQIPLPVDCVDAVKGNPDLWVDVEVDGASLGRTKLGAVPFAVEAGRATVADAATQADTALVADRVAVITDWTKDPGVRLHGIGDDKDVNNQTTVSTWRRVGDSLELNVTTSVTATPTQGTGGILWSLPAGLTADAEKMERDWPVGVAFVSHSGTLYACRPYLGGSLQEIALSCPYPGGPPIGITNVTWLQFTMTMPIEGWSNEP